jgi:hypothetical protein
MKTEEIIVYYESRKRELQTRPTSRKWKCVYNETRKRDLKIRPTYDCRYDERLKTKTEDSTRLTYTGFRG